MNNKNEIFGIHRTTLLVIAIAITFGSFSVYKALGGGASTARTVSGTALAAVEDVTVTTNNPQASATRLTNVPRPAVKTTLTPIEQIQVGDRVLAESPTGEEDIAFGSEIIPSDWRKLTLRAPKRDGTVAEVVLLRPLTWLNEQRSGRSFLPERTFADRRTNTQDAIEELGSEFGESRASIGRDESRSPARQAGPTNESHAVEDMVGGTVFISVPECGIDGNAHLLSIDPCPEIRPGGGRVVTGTFLHQARSTITLTIAGQSEPIECTGNHPFWSEDRQTFVRADSLQPNETLRTATGLTTVESWTPDLNPTPVYNIEVHGAHVYHVGTSGVVVHNGNDDCFKIIALGLNKVDGDEYALRKFADEFGAIQHGDWVSSGLVTKNTDPFAKFKPYFREALDNSDHVFFNLSGLDMDEAARGIANARVDGIGPKAGKTNYELMMILDHARDKTTFFLDGKVLTDPAAFFGSLW